MFPLCVYMNHMAIMRGKTVTMAIKQGLVMIFHISLNLFLIFLFPGDPQGNGEGNGAENESPSFQSAEHAERSPAYESVKTPEHPKVSSFFKKKK